MKRKALLEEALPKKVLKQGKLFSFKRRNTTKEEVEERKAVEATSRFGQLLLTPSQVETDEDEVEVHTVSSQETKARTKKSTQSTTNTGNKGCITQKKQLPRSPREREQWSKKHAPTSEAELVVHKQKILALKEFLKAHAEETPDPKAPKLILISGPSGCGKSATVGVVAAGVGLEVTEWEAPVPTLWSERLYQKEQGQGWESSLAAFESFVTRSKMVPLQMCTPVSGEGPRGSMQKRQRKTLVVIDDLPHAIKVEQRRKLIDLLSTLAKTTHNPVVVTLTVSFNSSSEQREAVCWQSGVHEDLSRSIEAAGGKTLTFNPITALNAAKVLKRIAEAEGIQLGASDATTISESSNGDLLNAIKTLQLYVSGKRNPKRLGKPQVKKAGSKRGQKSKAKGADVMPPSADLQGFLRDRTLSSFHALGKILYDIRGADGRAILHLSQQDTAAQPNAGLGGRPPMEVDPEAVIMASGLEPAVSVAFLHENFPNFVDDGAVEDLAAGLMHISDADRLLSHSFASSSHVAMESIGAGSNVLEACGGSVAARGLMWANAHPAPRRFLQLRGSRWFQVRQAQQLNAIQLQRIALGRGFRFGNSHRLMAVEILPFLRCMAHHGDPAAARSLPRTWARVFDGEVVNQDNAAAQSRENHVNLAELGHPTEAIEDSDDEADPLGVFADEDELGILASEKDDYDELYMISS